MAPLTRRTRCAAVAVLCLVAASCSGDGDEDPVRVTGAWARTSPHGVTTGAVYFTVRTAADDVLVGADVDPAVAASVELHATTRTGGTSTMAPLSEVELPAGEDVTFEPGGGHLMLVDLVAPLQAGDSFALTLQLAEQGPHTVDVEVGDGPP